MTNEQLSLEQENARCRAAGCAGAQPPVFSFLTMADAVWLKPLLKAENSPAASGCFGTHILWGPAYGLQAARVEGRVIFRYTSENGRCDYAYPAGSGCLRAAVCAAMADAAAHGVPLKMIGVTAVQKARLENEFPGLFSFEEDRDRADYLYEPEKLVTLAGRKLQSKRNHCNRFEAEQPDWSFETLRADHIPACMALFDEWAAARPDLPPEEIAAERRAIVLALEEMEKLEMLGGVLFTGDRLVGFTLGEMTGDNTFDVHFEKAKAEVNGAYPMVNRQFARTLTEKFPALKYINREEDLGMENLRKAKMTYQPALLLERFTATAEGTL